MKMLTSYQQELIHREIDGENTPEESAEVQKLVQTQPEALALMASLRSLDALFREVPDRVPPPRVTQSIYDAMSLDSKASPAALHAQGTTQLITKWAIQQWNGVTNLMEKSMLTKRVLIGVTTAVAVVAIIGYIVVDYKPSVYDAGTVGAGTAITGVEKAGRFRGHTLTEKDITLSNPAIGALFQNDKVLKLVKSEAFHEAMNNETFRELTSSEQFRELESSPAFHDLQTSEAFQSLLQSDASYNVLLVASHEANHDASAVAKNDVSHVLSSETYREILNSEAYHEITNNPAFHDMLKSDAFLNVLNNDAFRDVVNNQAFRDVLTNDAFLQVLNSDAFHDLQQSDVFMAIAHDANLTNAFLNEASARQQ